MAEEELLGTLLPEGGAFEEEDEELLGTLVPEQQNPTDVRNPQPPVFDIFKQAMNKRIGLEGTDIFTGVQDPFIRVNLPRMDTEEERIQLLTDRFGPNGFKSSPLGGFEVDPKVLEAMGLPQQGKPVLIDEVGITRWDILDFAGDALPLAGAVGGGIAASGLGVIPGAGIAALGGLTGVALDELIEHAQGLNLESFKQVAGRGALQAPLFLGPELATRGLAPFGRKLLGPNTSRGNIADSFTGNIGPLRSTIDSQRIALVDEALKIGVIPRVDQAVGSLRSQLVGRGQALSNTIFGDRTRQTNARNLLVEEGRLINRLAPGGGPRIEAIVNKIDAEQRVLEGMVGKQSNKLSKAIKGEISRLESSVGAKAGQNEGALIQRRIIDLHDGFKTQASRLYATVDEIAGGQALVGTNKIKKAAQTMMDEFPILAKETKDYLSTIVNMPGRISFKQAQNVRSQLLAAGRNPNLLKDVGNRNASILADSVQQSMDGAFLGNSLRAKKALLLSNKFYKDNIGKFDDVLIARLTKDLKQGGVPPERIVQTILGTKSSTQINKVRRLVGDDVWKQVRRGKLDDIIRGATDDVTGEVGAAQFNKGINDLGDTFSTFFGKDSQAIKRLARQLADRNAKINPQTLEGDVAAGLKSTLEAQKNLDTFMKQDFVNQLNRSRQNPGDLVEFMFKPGNERQLATAKTFFGAESAEWNTIKRTSLRRLMKNILVKGDDPVEVLLSGQNLAKQVDKHKKALTILLGKKHANEIKRFADVAFLATSKSTLTSGIVAANIALHPIKNLGKLGQIWVMGDILNSPTTIRLFTKGLEAPTLRKLLPSATRLAGQAAMAGSVNSIVTSNADRLRQDLEN